MRFGDFLRQSTPNEHMDPGATRLPSPLDLSQAERLKYLAFDWGAPDLEWIPVVLETARPKCLPQITFTYITSPNPSEGMVQVWHQLDHLLTQSSIPRSVLLEIKYVDGTGNLGQRLLPELTRRGVVREVCGRPSGLITTITASC